GEPSRRVEAPVVGGQRAATCLGTRHLHPPPVHGQDTDRGAVHLAEPSILHAAAQQRDGSPALTGRLRHAGEAAEQLGSVRRDAPAPSRSRARAATAASPWAAPHPDRAPAGTGTGGSGAVRPGRVPARPSGRTARATDTRPRTRGRRDTGP